MTDITDGSGLTRGLGIGDSILGSIKTSMIQQLCKN
jgi:hypothetical protein